MRLSTVLAAAWTVVICLENPLSAIPPHGSQSAVPLAGKATGFGAYYTQLSAGQAWEAYSRTGEFADVVVSVAKANGSLVFWRGNSYLPYWKTEKGQWNLDEIIPRSGDGTEPMPDRNNVYSHVEVIENTPQHVIVYWRYLSSFVAGNPHGNVKLDHFVEETFTITPDGKVNRIIKQAADKIDDWKDPLNQTEQNLQLKEDGVEEVSIKDPAHSTSIEKIVGNPGNKVNVVDPVLWFKFDEGAGTETTESVTRSVLPIAGPKALWKKGIAGTALEFDGYHSSVALPAARAPHLSSGSITVEGWFALGAYPWNWAPIVQQGENKGYFLGVDSHGYPGFMIQVNGSWQQLTVPSSPPYNDPNHLNLFQWYNVAGTYNKQDGTMRLYVNGKEVANKKVGTGGLQKADDDVRVGKSGILSNITDGDTRPSDFGFDGLIDEVRVYDRALDASQISESFANFNPGSTIVAAPDMQKRHLPTFVGDGKFKAFYTHLPYYETWDNLWSVGKYSDLVVQFDQSPMKLVFWRGTAYIPIMVNESNQWYMNEFNETGFTKDAPGDCEPMSDKPCLDSHVRVIENTDARVVVHWRYRLANPGHHWANYDDKTGWGDIADWYYYIYPDGVISKRMRCYSSLPNSWHEWDEQIIVLSEGQHPESVIRKTPVMTLVDPTGKASDYDWNPNPPNPAYGGKIIQMIHLMGRYSPFTIQEFNDGDVYSGASTWYSVFPSWNHWPTSQIDSSSRNSSFSDRAAHSSISHLFWPLSGQQRGDVPYQEKTLMEGMTDQPASSLVSLANSWLHAPPLETISDCRSQGYDQTQRAYVLSATGPAPSFRITASAQNPIVNLCFVVKNWNCEDSAQLQIDSKAEGAGPSFRQGIVRDPNGRATLVVWLQRQGTDPVTFTLHGAKPDLENQHSMTWATNPQPVANTTDVTMTATAHPGIGNEYWFERVGGGGDTSGWQSAPVYTDFALPANTEVAYRVKARDAYFAETNCSPVAKVKTTAPAPVTWSLDEGEGKTIKDTAGRHDVTIQGDLWTDHLGTAECLLYATVQPSLFMEWPSMALFHERHSGGLGQSAQ